MKQLRQSEKIPTGRVIRGPLQKRLLIMKLTSMLLLVFCIQASAKVFSQQVTLNARQVPLEIILRDISEQTGYTLLYSNETIQKAVAVSITVDKAPIVQVLDKLFSVQPLTYRLDGKTILVKDREVKAAINLPVNAWSFAVRGKITDEQGNALAGVTIVVSGTSNGAISDRDGLFTFTVPDPASILVFTYIGYDRLELAAGAINALKTIVLHSSINNLKEVTVNKGYYREKKELTTGDISAVSSEEIAKQPVSDPLAALEGRVPGLNVTQSLSLIHI